jgi:hypothetical protein
VHIYVYVCIWIYIHTHISVCTCMHLNILNSSEHAYQSSLFCLLTVDFHKSVKFCGIQIPIWELHLIIFLKWFGANALFHLLKACFDCILESRFTLPHSLKRKLAPKYLVCFRQWRKWWLRTTTTYGRRRRNSSWNPKVRLSKSLHSKALRA